MKVGLGRTSKRRLKTCCPPIQHIVEAAAANGSSPCDFGVVCGSRNKEDQTAALMSGRSNAKWGESDHNVMKGDKPYAMAIDIAPYSAKINNYVWDDKELYEKLAYHIMETAVGLGYALEWGGTYKMKDGKGDMPHYSLLF